MSFSKIESSEGKHTFPYNIIKLKISSISKLCHIKSIEHIQSSFSTNFVFKRKERQQEEKLLEKLWNLIMQEFLGKGQVEGFFVHFTTDLSLGILMGGLNSPKVKSWEEN